MTAFSFSSRFFLARRCRREAILYAATHAKLVWLEERGWECRSRPAAEERRNHGEPRHLQDEAVDGVNGRLVPAGQGHLG